MQLRITNSIASAEWSYAPSQLVSIGTDFTADTIPAEVASVWLESGLAERTQEVETATLKPAKRISKK